MAPGSKSEDLSRSDLSLDAPLRDVFLQEARAYTAILEDAAAGHDAWRDAVLGFSSAASMLGLKPLVQLLDRLEGELSHGAPAAARLAEVTAWVADLEALAREDGSPATAASAAAPVSAAPPAPPSEPVPAPPAVQVALTPASFSATLPPIGGGPVGPPTISATLPLRPRSGPETFDIEESRALRELFSLEAHERLDEIDAALQLLESLEPLAGGASPEPRVRELTGEMLRAAHTLKGAAGTVGRAAVAEASHLLEEHVARVRDGRAAMSPTVAEALHTTLDAIRALVDEMEETVDAPARVRSLGQRLADATATARGRLSPPLAAEVPVLALPGTEAPQSPDWDLRLDRRRGERSVIRVEVDRVEALAEYGSELVIDRTRMERRALEIRNVHRSVSACRVALKQALALLRQGRALEATAVRRMPAAPRQRPAQLTGGRGTLVLEPSPTAARPGGVRLGDIVAPLEAKLLASTFEARLSELEVRLTDASTNLERALGGLTDDIESLRRTSSLLQSGLTRVRMTAVRWLMGRLGRPLRDLARRHGKLIDLHTEGEETELDKAMVEQIADPLLHLIRNAVAHGIEAPEARRAAGKPDTGTVRVSARHQAEHVYLEIADDGAGIDVEAIRAALVRRGLDPSQAAGLSSAQLLDTIFLAGFSTRESVDDLAGRGIGLDAVQSAVVRLGGEVVVRSERGLGTTFTIRLPLTTAITQALLFKVAGEVYAVPMANVLETVLIQVEARSLASSGATSEERRRESLGGAAARPSVTLRSGETVALLPLDVLLGLSFASGRARMAVVLFHGAVRFALPVDKVVGPREIAVRRLGDLLTPLRLYAGATISGSGKVQLILDVPALAAHAQGLEAALAAGQPAPRGPAEETDPAADRPRLAGERALVLLVDDSRTVREGLRRVLIEGGFHVEEAVDGLEAWEMLEGRRYDLMITDLEMPRLQGLDLIARVRRDPRHARLPVVAVSSRVEAGPTARAAGAVAFLPKPVARRALMEVLGRITGTAGRG